MKAGLAGMTWPGRPATIRLSLLLLLLVVGALASCAPGEGPGFFDESNERVIVSDGWLAMGTFFEADLRVASGQEARAREWLAECRDTIARLERIYSRHDPESEVSRLNRDLDGPDILRDGTRVSPELEAILFTAIEVFEASGGAFDPTVGPLVELWTAAAEAGRWPDLDALRRAKRKVGSGGLLLPGGGEIGVTARGMRLDLDGLSKGVVLDHLRAEFEEGFPGAAALVSFGESSLLALGDPEGRREGGGWRLEVRSRGEEDRRLTTIQLRDRALSVSSSVGRVSMIEGQRVSHVVDPRTGGVVEREVESVVIADRAGIADGWSTALLVLGASRASLRLVERASIEAYVFESGGRIAATEGFEAFEVEAAR